MFRISVSGNMAREPNFANLRRALLLQGEPAYVPLVEFGIDLDVKTSFLGRPINTLADEIEFWAKAGYDYVPFQAGIRTLFWPGVVSTEKKAADVSGLQRRGEMHYSLYRDTGREMAWAEEGTGAIASLADFERFPWPDANQYDFSAFEEAHRLLPPGMKILVNLGCIFTSAWMLMGMENFFVSLSDNPELICRLYDRIWSIQSRTLLRVLDYDVVGGVFHADDLAHASGTLVSPRHLRQYVFPFYRWCAAVLRDRGLPHILHSDGKVTPVIEDVLACGFNALHPIEPKVMNIVELKRAYRGRLCLIGNIDLNYTLSLGTPEEVRNEVAARISAVGPGGGYCLGSSNSVTAYVPMANFNAMREAVFEYGTYPLRSEELRAASGAAASSL
jgi:uroporphyrinogen decarboxylase